MNKRRAILSRLENLMIAIRDLRDCEDFGPGAAALISRLKEDFQPIVAHINKMRKKVKAQNVAKPTHNSQR